MESDNVKLVQVYSISAQFILKTQRLTLNTTVLLLRLNTTTMMHCVQFAFRERSLPYTCISSHTSDVYIIYIYIYIL